MDLASIWQQTLAQIKNQLDPAQYQTFLAKTHLISIDKTHATISCPNNYSLSINQSRYKSLITIELNKFVPNSVEIQFIIDLSKPSQKTISDTPLFQPETIRQVETFKHGLNPRYTFANLVVGNSNNFAYAAAQAITTNPGSTYNPLFIWGGVGVGKTHLMQAIGHELISRNPNYKLRYFPAETFTNDLYQALRTKTIDRFKETYRSLDCMIVDDIQFIAGKEYAQEEFFHTFNALYLTGKQIILASDRKPSEIRSLEDRLISRFSGGLNVDIQLPDYEMRLSILKQKSEDKNLKITPQALNYLAENNPGNIRDLEGKLQEAALLAISRQEPEITIESLTSHQNTTPQLIHNQNPRHILSICAKNLNIKTGDLVGKSRKKDLIFARHLTAYILLTIGKLSLQEVGELLGGRDHTSIIHARNKIHQALSTNTQLSLLFHQISSQLSTN